jgi:putative peptidoglycan lipid II flippase
MTAVGGTSAAGSGPRLGFVAIVLAGSVALSRVLGVVREMALSHVLGISSEVDAYRAAFLLPDLLNYLLAGGVLSIVFIPFYTRMRSREGDEAAQRFLALVLGTTALLAALGTLAMWLAADRLVALQFDFPAEQAALATRLTRILLPAQIFFVAGGVLRGALMARGHFASQSLAPLVYNLAIIAGGLALGGRLGAEGFAWGALAGAALGAFGTAWLEARRVFPIRIRVALRDPVLRRYLVATLPLVLGATMVTVDEWYDKWFGARLASGTISALTYARQLMLLPVAMVGQAIATAALPTLARLSSEGREPELNETLLGALRAGLALACAAAAGAFVFAEPIVRLLFEGGRFDAADTRRVADLLQIFAFAIPAWIAQQIAGRGFYARGHTWALMWLGSAIALCAAGLYWMLGQRDGAAGLAMAGAIAMNVNAVATLGYLRARYGGPSLGAVAHTMARAAGIAVVAALAAAFVPPIGSGRLGAAADLAVGGALFAAIAIAGVQLAGDPPLRNAVRAIGRRLVRRGR